jgi:hypothetical protein
MAEMGAWAGIAAGDAEGPLWGGKLPFAYILVEQTGKD